MMPLYCQNVDVMMRSLMTALRESLRIGEDVGGMISGKKLL